MIKQDIKVGGIYKHYKGQKYRVLCVSRHSEDLSWYVVYEALYDNDVSTIWHRPVDMFTQEIVIDGKNTPRFQLSE